jgi:transcriptional regulator with XRE-family HTH domain
VGARDGSGELAALVRRLRNARGLSQNALSAAARLAPSYINQLESGARGKRPQRDKILAIAQALRTSPKETADLLRAAGFGDEIDATRPTFEEYVGADPLLRSDQKAALVAQYRTYVRGGQ